jgi:anti-anti-sigma factor
VDTRCRARRDGAWSDGSNLGMRTPCAPSRLTMTPAPIPGLAHQLALTLAGKLGHGEVEALQSFLTAYLGSGGRFLVLDVSKVVHACSTPLGLLVKVADDLTKRGGGLALVATPPKLRIVIEMLGLDAFFLLCDDLQDAVRALPHRAERLEATRVQREEQAARLRAKAEADARARRAAALDAQDAALEALAAAGPGWLTRAFDAWAGGALTARARTLEEQATRTWCLELEGPFDERAPALWRDTVDRGRAAGVTTFALDLTRATRVRPAALGWLVRWARELREAGCALAFVAAGPREHALLCRHDLHRHFRLERVG